jgi:uncharacterized membrane protein
MLTLEAALFLAKGNLFLSAENIALLAATRIGYNPEFVESLAQQNADTWVGVVLLLSAFVLQMWNAVWPLRWHDFHVHESGAVLALVFSILLSIPALYLSEHVANCTAKKVKAELTARGVAG